MSPNVVYAQGILRGTVAYSTGNPAQPHRRGSAECIAIVWTVIPHTQQQSCSSKLCVFSCEYSQLGEFARRVAEGHQTRNDVQFYATFQIEAIQTNTHVHIFWPWRLFAQRIIIRCSDTECSVHHLDEHPYRINDPRTLEGHGWPLFVFARQHIWLPKGAA